MNRLLILLVLAFIAISAAPIAQIAESSSVDRSRPNKIHPSLYEKIARMDDSEVVEVLIRLKPLPSHVRERVRGSHDLAKSSLKLWSEITQSKVTKFIVDSGGVVLNRFWIDNVVLAKVRVSLLKRLALLDDVVLIFENFRVEIPRSSAVAKVEPREMVESWGVHRVQAPSAWGMGYTGAGVRIAVLDTGVDVEHPALSNKMLSVIPGDPHYPGGWMAFDSYGNPVRSIPHDTHGHGTHVSGTALGGDTSNILIGVAPGATLMHGLVLPYGSGTLAQVLAGMEWTVDPYYIDEHGNIVYTGLPAHVVSMSLGATGYYGNELLPPIENMLLMNIIPVAAIGNAGEGISASPGNIWGVFGIGATDPYDEVPPWSSGEVVFWPEPPEEWPFYDHYPQIYVKPDLSAPGVFIVSSVPGGYYEAWDGTSMATPHVSGTVALVLEAAGWLYYDFPDTPETVYTILKETSLDLGEGGQDIRYGWGLISAYQAVLKALEYAKPNGVEGFVRDAITGEPIAWAAVYIEELGRSYYVRENGYFRIPLDPGIYRLTFSAWGYYNEIIEVEVLPEQFTQVEVLMDRLPHGYVRGTVMGSDGVVIAGADVIALETPMSTKTDESGRFKIWLPAGLYTLLVRAPGYSDATVDVHVTAGAEIDLGTIVLQRVPRVAVMWDFAAAFTRLIGLLGYYAEPHTNLTELNLKLKTGFYDAVIYSGYYYVPFPTYEEFVEFIELVDKLGIGAIFMDSYGRFGYGIKVLHEYLGDPKSVGYGWGWGEVHVSVERAHPIFRGYSIGDVVMINSWRYADFSAFWDFSGETLGGLVVAGSRLGDAVAVKTFESGAKWILLSSFAITQWNTPDTFTYDYWVILVNSIVYAIMKPLRLELENSRLHVGDVAKLYISGGEPYSVVNVYLDEALLGSVRLDREGRAVFLFKVPLIPGGEHAILAYSADYRYFGTTRLYILPKLEVRPTYVVVPDVVKIEVTGLKARQLFYVYLDGNTLSMLRSNESGALTELLNIPIISSGLHALKLVSYETGEVLYSVEIVVTSPLEELAARLEDAASSIAHLNASLHELRGVLEGVIGDVAVIRNGTNYLLVSLGDLNARVLASIRLHNETYLLLNTSLGYLLAKLRDIDSKVDQVIERLDKLVNRTATLESKVAALEDRDRDLGTAIGMSQTTSLISLVLAIIALIAAVLVSFFKK